MINDITFFCQIVITDVIFFYEKWSFIDFFECFLIWFFIYFYDFCILMNNIEWIYH